MKAVLFAYSRQGCRTARRVMDCFSQAEIRAYTIQRFSEPGFLPLPHPSRPLYGEAFSWADTLIFIGSAGIAVREISPFVKDKRTDPAVLCIDERGGFAIPLLSGHIGGANALALRLAAALGATPVVTTATDINGKFSVDAWAARQGLFIADMQTAKSVSAAILEGPVPLVSDFPIATRLPSGVIAGEIGELGICISCQKKQPFARTLLLVPPLICLGIGCRRGISAEAVAAAVDAVLKERQIHPKAVRQVASINLKAEEEGLLAFCKKRGLPLAFYSADALRALPGSFTASERVFRVTGVDNVCERAAMMQANTLLIEKTVFNGVTVAAAVKSWEVRFEEAV